MELVLGLKPMSQFDAAATPMYNSFQPQPDARPYAAAPAQVDLNERNGKLAWEATGLAPERGHIGLQAEGAPLEFRNLQVREIK